MNPRADAPTTMETTTTTTATPAAQGLYIGPTGATTAPAGAAGAYTGAKYSGGVTAASLDEDYAPLRRWNLTFGVVHLLQGVVILVLGAILARGPVPMQTSFPGYSSAGFVPGLQGRGYFHPGAYISIIFLVSSLAHFIQYGTHRSWVNNTDKYRANRWRWFEYSVSVGWMFFLVAMVMGLHDILGALLFMAAVSSQMYLQLSMDLVNGNITHRGRTEWLPHVLAWIPFAYVVVTLFSFQYSEPFRNDAPGLTFAITMVAIFFLLCYLLVQAGYFAKSIRSYVAYEKAYIIVNAIAKTAVGWLLFAFFVQLFYGIDGSSPTPVVSF
jgi:uncharacterized membrane protein SirB2